MTARIGRMGVFIPGRATPGVVGRSFCAGHAYLGPVLPLLFSHWQYQIGTATSVCYADFLTSVSSRIDTSKWNWVSTGGARGNSHTPAWGRLNFPELRYYPPRESPKRLRQSKLLERVVKRLSFLYYTLAHFQFVPQFIVISVYVYITRYRSRLEFLQPDILNVLESCRPHPWLVHHCE